MKVKKINPITPGQRFRILPDFSHITKNKPEKSLLVFIKKKAGRNNSGKIMVKNRGGGHKKRMRVVDFLRKKYNIPAVVKSIEYDPIRTAFIAMLYYKDGKKSYIIAPENIKIGSIIFSSKNNIVPEIGNAMPLNKIPLGTAIHNIELTPGKGGVISRSAGTYTQLLARKDNYAILKLPSGEMRRVLSKCMATIGSVSNSYHVNIILGKAGRNRWLGRRPRTRGVAMNPVDHPMGGGEGKASGGHPVSEKGLYAKGKKTRLLNKYSNRLIIEKSKK